MKVLLLLFAFMVFNYLCGQERVDYSLTAFHGPVYQMPRYSEQQGLQAGVAHFDSVGHIVLPELKFTPGLPEEHFPSLGLKNRFAFDLTAKLTINTAACYFIMLPSDDGSKLWIDERLSIDNDGMHQWKIGRDTLYLTSGAHDLKLLYYNGVGPSGLAFRVSMTDSIHCSPKSVASITACVTFSENDHYLDQENQKVIRSLIATIDWDESTNIEVIGYASTKGPSEDNELLSQNRAASVKAYIVSQLEGYNGTLSVSGEGEVDDLNGEVGSCQSNRAVVIRITE